MDGDNDSEAQNQTGKVVALAYGLLFAAVAPLAGYLNLFLQRCGLTDSQIGTVAATMALVGIVAPPLWGYVSDRWHNRRVPIALASLGSALVFLAFFKPSFPSVLLVAVLFAFFNSPLIPLMDALVLEWLGDARERYGSLRAWGSWGFVVMMLVFGLTLKGNGKAQGLLPPLASFVLLRWLLFVVARRLPPNGGHRLSGDGDWHALKSLFVDRQWQTFLGISLLSTISNGAFYAFFPLYLNRAGLGDNWQGYFWVIAVLAEIAFMAKLAAPLTQRLGLKGVMLLGILGRMVRYGAYAFPLPFSVLLALQLLHALTFGAAHTASVTWVSLFAPPSARALMQTLYASILMGIGNAIGAQLGGWVSEHWGLRVMFGLAGALNAIAFGLGWCWLREPIGNIATPVLAKRREG
ncbi:MAG: hypothetical protein SLRJCFUN_001094 [Candidatus Fervidibacter sp.]